VGTVPDGETAFGAQAELADCSSVKSGSGLSTPAACVWVVRTYVEATENDLGIVQPCDQCPMETIQLRMGKETTTDARLIRDEHEIKSSSLEFP